MDELTPPRRTSLDRLLGERTSAEPAPGRRARRRPRAIPVAGVFFGVLWLAGIGSAVALCAGVANLRRRDRSIPWALASLAIGAIGMVLAVWFWRFIVDPGTDYPRRRR